MPPQTKVPNGSYFEMRSEGAIKTLPSDSETVFSSLLRTDRSYLECMAVMQSSETTTL